MRMKRRWSIFLAAVFLVGILAGCSVDEPLSGVASQPETKQSGSKQSDKQEPDTEQPEIEEPDTQEPDTEQPEIEEPDTQEPDTEQLEIEEPDTQESGNKEPDTEEQNGEEETNMGIIGVCHTSSTNASADEWGLKLTAMDISQTGLTLVATNWNDEEGCTLETGSYFLLERYSDGKWEEVEMLIEKDDLAWTEEAWTLEEEGNTEWEVDWNWLYGELPAGSYRIGKEMMYFRGTGDVDKKMYYANFDLVDLRKEKTVTCEGKEVSISLDYREGWEYRVVEYDEAGGAFGVCFRPAGKDGWVSLYYYRGFGVCGTELKEKRITLENGLSGQMGIYEDNDNWSFIAFQNPYKGYVATAEVIGDWWTQFESEVMEILNTAVLVQTAK